MNPAQLSSALALVLFGGTLLGLVALRPGISRSWALNGAVWMGMGIGVFLAPDAEAILAVLASGLLALVALLIWRRAGA